MDALIRRMRALGDTKVVLRAVQFSVIHEAQALTPRKTGNLQRSIVPGELTDTHATVIAGANYALFVEQGTGLYGPKHHLITPKTKKALHWKGGGPSKVRLTGRSRTKDGASLADDVFATSTKGARAQPFLGPGAKRAIKKAGLADVVTTEWNKAG